MCTAPAPVSTVLTRSPPQATHGSVEDAQAAHQRIQARAQRSAEPVAADQPERTVPTKVNPVLDGIVQQAQGHRGSPARIRGHTRNPSYGKLIGEWDDLLGGHASAGHSPSPENTMVCRICEERVDLRWAEEHTRCCVLLSRSKQDALACHEPLRKLSIVLVDKVAERHRLRQQQQPSATITERLYQRLWREAPPERGRASSHDDPLLDTGMLLQAHTHPTRHAARALGEWSL